MEARTFDMDLHLADRKLERDILRMSREELSNLDYFVRNELNKRLYIERHWSIPIKKYSEIVRGY